MQTIQFTFGLILFAPFALAMFAIVATSVVLALKEIKNLVVDLWKIMVYIIKN